MRTVLAVELPQGMGCMREEMVESGGGDGDGEPAGRWMATVGLGWQRLKPVGEPFCRVAGL